MAFSRLFGKSTKKDPPSPGSNNSSDLSEREGDHNFTLIDQAPPAPNSEAPPTYQSLNQLPYQLPQHQNRGGAGAAGGPGVKPAKLQSQLSHPLEGVVFHLSPKLATDSELDQMTQTVDNLMSRMKSMEWAAFDYNFALEKSVLSSDLRIDQINIEQP